MKVSALKLGISFWRTQVATRQLVAQQASIPRSEGVCKRIYTLI